MSLANNHTYDSSSIQIQNKKLKFSPGGTHKNPSSYKKKKKEDMNETGLLVTQTAELLCHLPGIK